jgi:hypothetical protein
MRKKAELVRFVTAAATTAILFVCFPTVVAFSQQYVAEANQPAQGELKIEGKFIKQLVLESKDGERQRFDQPAESIKLAAGQYRVREVHLEGGYDCIIRQFSDEDWITVDANKPATLKAGAPLKQILKAERQGRILALSYELSGIGGENYVRDDRSSPPTFTVYKRDKKIASGTFEYG